MIYVKPDKPVIVLGHPLCGAKNKMMNMLGSTNGQDYMCICPDNHSGDHIIGTVAAAERMIRQV